VGDVGSCAVMVFFCVPGIESSDCIRVSNSLPDATMRYKLGEKLSRNRSKTVHEVRRLGET
jgi:hypothetical protein